MTIGLNASENHKITVELAYTDVGSAAVERMPGIIQQNVGDRLIFWSQL